MNAIELGLNVLAFVFGVVWLWINVYLNYPLVTVVLKRLFGAGGARSPSRGRRDRPSGEDGATGERVSDGGTNVSQDRLTFDVLLPAYDESGVIENSIASVRGAAYDQERINLVVLTEPDDDETREVLTRLAEDYAFTELCVPEAYPGEQNKPRALNYGFERTSGDIVSIIDAENVFHPLLFEQANERFGEGDVDFLQGRLDMVNEDDGWLNTLFRAEYGYWYQVVFPPFFDADYPIPIGGTTCLFRRSVLERISDLRRERYGDDWTGQERQWVREHGLDGLIPWDPENVTEDFELGLFLWQNGFESGFLPGPSTDEESPLTLDSWMGQRTRWQKGKVYTLLNYLRRPPDTVRDRAHLLTQSSIPHLGVINIFAIFLLLLAANMREYDWHILSWSLLIGGAGWIGLTVGLYGVGYWSASTVPIRTRIRRTVIVLLTVPFYWVLNWIADLRAFVQTYRGDFHWVKTTHAGRNMLSQVAPSEGSVSDTGDRWKLQREHRLLGLLLVTATAAGTRLYNLTGWSIYGDELYTVAVRANLPTSELLFVSHDTHPPLHYLLLHYWMELFGNSVTSIRLLSVVFSVGAVVAVYYLGVELYDDRVGLLAALLMALSVHHVHHGQNARMYSLFTFLSVVSWYGFARFTLNSRRGGLIYVSSTILLLYTHLFAVFVILAQNVYVALAGQRNVDWRRWVRRQAVVALAVTPVIWFVLSSLFSASDGGMGAETTNLIGWLAPPTLYVVFDLFRHWFGIALNYPLTQGASSSLWITTILFFVYAVLVFTAGVRYRSDKEFELTKIESASQMAVLISIVIVVPFVLSYVLFPMFYARYAIPASVGLFLLVGKGTVNLDRRWLVVAVTVLLVLASAGMLADHYTNRSEEPFEGAVRCLAAETEPGDTVLVQTLWEEDAVEDTPLAYFELFSERETHLIPPPGSVTEQDVDEIEEHLNGSGQVHLLVYLPDKRLDRIQSSRFFETISENRDQKRIVESPAIHLYQFDDPSSPEASNRSAASRRQSLDERCSDPR